MRAQLVLAVALCALSAAVVATDVQLKVLAAPNGMSFATSNARVPLADAPAVLAHLTGAAASPKQPTAATINILPAAHPLNKPVAGLIALVAGAGPTAALEPTLATLTVTVPTDASYAEQAASLLAGSTRPSANSLLDAVSSTSSYVVSLSASSSVLSAVSVRPGRAGAQHISLFLDVAQREVRLQSTTNEVAETLVAGINAQLSRAAADASRLDIEEAAAKALIDVIDVRAEFGQEDDVDLVFISFDASAAAADEVSATLRDLAAEFAATFNGNALVQAVFMPTAAPERAKSSAARRDLKPEDVVLPYTCYTTVEDCVTASTNCTTVPTATTVHGTCLQFGTTDSPCFRCKCNGGYAGDYCEYYDMVHQFSTTVFVSIFLIVIVISVIAALTTIDSGTETILYRTATKAKKTQ